MYIIGTSGHIDHGKTSIIRQLTGIDCDRLPEEKEREMTIDIGFASIDYPKFGTVGVIDVPGHERFIRNMVAGAWGIDCAMLVVAADDGWMPQTDDHFRVLVLLGVERIIGVINKIDLADDEMAAFVEEEMREKLTGGGFPDADIVRVSARTRAGIDDLKNIIHGNLKKLSKAADAKRPYLFIDRAFASKGHGTVVTGTLKNGVFHENETVTILPVKKQTKIKKIESHFHGIEESSPSQRVALNITGIPLDDVGRGAIVCLHNFFTETDEIVAAIRLSGKRRLKNNQGIEVLIGTADITGRLILLNDADESGDSIVARIKFNSPWYVYPGEPFILTGPGGFRIIGGGRVVLTHYEAGFRREARSKAASVVHAGTREILNYIVTVNRWIAAGSLAAMFPQGEKLIMGIVSELAKSGAFVIIDNMVLDSEYHHSSLETVMRIIKEGLGLNLKEISDRSGVDEHICRLLLPGISAHIVIVEKDGRYFTGEAVTSETLSDEKKNVLSAALEASGNGLELEKITDQHMKKNVQELIRLGFLVSLDGNIIYHRDAYTSFKVKIMALFDARDKISVPEAKDAVGLSRKFILPLLNKIESEGLLKRIGDFRIKA